MSISEYLPTNYFQILQTFLKKLGIPWNDIHYYIEAFTHGSSYLNQKTKINYQRLEFLGDAVLDSEVSYYLFKKYPDWQEGELTKIRAKMIQEKTLAKISDNIGISKVIILAKNLSNTTINNKILADCFESLLGAIYVDLGHNSVAKFLNDHFLVSIDKILKQLDIYDYKTELQEKIHALNNGFIVYKILKPTNLNNNNLFNVGIYLNKKILAKGIGTTRKEAEQLAAKNALVNLK